MDKKKMIEALESCDLFNAETGKYIWKYNDNNEYGVTFLEMEEVKEFISQSDETDFYEYAIGGRCRGYIVDAEEIESNDFWMEVTKENLREWLEMENRIN